MYIGLCIILFFTFANDKGISRLVALPFFLIGMYQLIYIARHSLQIIDNSFPPKTKYEEKTKPFDKFMYYFSSTLLFISLICFIFGGSQYDMTIHGVKLFWIAGAIGIAVAVVVTIILKITAPSVYYDSERRYVVHSGLFVGLFLLAAIIGGFTNRFYADNTKICKSHTIIKKEISGGRSTSYFIYLKFDDNYEERFSIGMRAYDNFNEGEEIEVCIVKGLFGYDYITNFKKIRDW